MHYYNNKQCRLQLKTFIIKEPKFTKVTKQDKGGFQEQKK